MPIGEFDSARLAEFPARPPSEVEWEDLLYRFELMTRALKVALEEVPRGSPTAQRVLRRHAEREEGAGRLFERAAFGDEPPAIEPDHADSSDVAHTADRFLRARFRNFAMLQRRGVDVWEWRLSTPDAEITTYQLLIDLARGDVDALAELRRLSVAAT